MSWNFFSKRPKSVQSQATRLPSLDKKLVQRVQAQSVPKLSQLKYIGRFLNLKEKVLLAAALFAVFVGLVGVGVAYLSLHLESAVASGGEYTEALIGEPKYVNPLFASVSDVDSDITSLIYAGLFRYDKDQKLQPEIAESYEVSTSSKVYTIHLRQDVRFADNEPLTADDVLYTIDLIQNPEVASPLLPSFQGVTAAKLNDYTVQFTLKAPFAPFLGSLTVGILPEHIWGDYNPGSIRLAKNNLEPIGAGPWKFSKLLKTDSGSIDSYTLSRNDYYFKQKPYFDTIQFKFFDNYTNALDAIRSGAVDGLSFLPHQQKIRLNQKNIAFYNLYLPQYTALFFNQTVAPMLKDANVRDALAKAIDKNALIASALSGEASAISSPVLPGSLGYNEPTSTLSFSIDDANSLLDKKWSRIEPEEYFKTKHDTLLKLFVPTTPISTTTTPTTTATTSTEATELAAADQTVTQNVRNSMDADQSFYRKDKDGTILEITITTGDTNEYDAVAQQIAKMWEKIGVKTIIEKVNPHQLIRDQVKNRSYQVLLYGEIIGSDPDPFPFWHSSQTAFPGLNIAQYSSSKVDKILEDARVTNDEAKRADLYGKFATEIAKDNPAVFLYSPVHTMAINRSVKGVSAHYINSPSDRFDDLSSWYTKTKLKWK